MKQDWSYWYGILFNCPVGKRLEDCPFNQKEKLSFKDKLAWFENLPDIEKGKLITHHIKCSNKRKRK